MKPSPRGIGNTSPAAVPNTSLTAAEALPTNDGAERRLCAWCREPLDFSALSCSGRRLRSDAAHCSKLCRQTAFRARQLFVLEGADGAAKRLGVFDPPYLGLAKRYYGNEPSYAGEVDHKRLLERCATYDGWALACSVDSLRVLLPMCPPGVRIGSWVKPGGVPKATRGPHNRWEAVLFVPARCRQPGVRDFLRAQPARGGGTLMGRKPLAWCAWVFQLLGAAPGDTLDDAFPGTGVVSKAWRQFQTSRSTRATSRSHHRATRRLGTGKTSLEASRDPSPRGVGDASSEYSSDVAESSSEVAA